jgi:hypothetical protein
VFDLTSRMRARSARYAWSLLEILTSVSSEPEASLVTARLAEAGIHVIARRSIGGPEWGVSGARDLYVEERDLDRAREVLRADEGVSEDQLADLSDAAAPRLEDPD